MPISNTSTGTVRVYFKTTRVRLDCQGTVRRIPVRENSDDTQKNIKAIRQLAEPMPRAIAYAAADSEAAIFLGRRLINIPSFSSYPRSILQNSEQIVLSQRADKNQDGDEYSAHW